MKKFSILMLSAALVLMFLASCDNVGKSNVKNSIDDNVAAGIQEVEMDAHIDDSDNMISFSEEDVVIQDDNYQDTKNYYNSYYSQIGLGMTVNLIDGSYTDPLSGRLPLFNQTSINKLTVSNKQIKRSFSTESEYNSVEQKIEDYSRSIEAKLAVNKMRTVRTKILSNKKFSLNIDYQNNYIKRSAENSYVYLKDLNNKFYAHEYYFDNYIDSTQFSNALSDRFKLDALNLQNNLTEANIQKFITNYGTHLISSVIRGAELNINMSAIGEESSIREKVNNIASVGLFTSIGRWETQVDAGLNITNETFSSSKTVNLNIDANLLGGTNQAFDETNIEYFPYQLREWAESTNNPENYIFVDVADDSLYPIWSLLDDSYAEVKEALDSYLEEKATSAYYEAMKKINLLYDDDFEFNQKYEGYIRIYTKDDLLKIKDEPSKKYVLMNNIDFSNEIISPLPNFSGIFDGNGHTISNVNLVVSGYAKAGLFESVSASAVISNLIVNNSNVTFNLNNNTSSGSFGLIAGVNYGRIENCEVNNSILSGYIKYSPSSGNYVKINCGAIVGMNSSGTIINCKAKNNNVNSKADGDRTDAYVEANVASIVGMNINQNAVIQNCSAINNTVKSCTRGGKTVTFIHAGMNSRAAGICAYNGVDGIIYSCTVTKNTLTANYEQKEGIVDNFSKTGNIVAVNDAPSGFVKNNTSQ